MMFEYFNTAVVRAANLPIQNFEKSKGDIVKFYKESKLFQTAILIASKSLYEDIEKGKVEKYKKSLTKYFNRSHFNAVPFGLFSSVDLLRCNTEETFLSKKNNYFQLDVLWDHHFLSKVKFSQNDLSWPDNSLYFSNPSLNKYFGDKINFVKTKLTQEGILYEEYASVDDDENLGWLVDFFKNGKTVIEFIEELAKSGFGEEEVTGFLIEVIESGILINDFLFTPYENSISKSVGKKYGILGNCTLNSENAIEQFKAQYLTTLDEIKKDFEVDNKNYFSITSFSQESGVINQNVLKKVERYISFSISLNKNKTPVKNRLQKFGNDYYHLFCDGYTPLGKVFDLNYGAEYEDKTASQTTGTLMHSKILEKVFSSKKSIDLYSKDFTVDISEIELPSTFGVMYEMLKCNKTGKELIFMKSLGGASSIPMLTRFQTKTGELLREISDFEQSIYDKTVFAEINYLPQTRAKNIYAKEQYYKYSIAINTLPTANNIPLNDLFINFDGNKFNLYSKTLNKIVIPKITSAIDYSNCSNDLYKFLCDLQFQNGEIYSTNFDFNNQQNVFTEYIPRIFLDDEILLSPAQMLLTFGSYKDFDDFKIKLLVQIESHNFSSHILIPDQKGYSVIGLSDEELKVLYDQLLEKRLFYIKEHIYDFYLPIVEDDDSQSYCHEIITCVKNLNVKENVISAPKVFHNEYPINSAIVSEWFFIELYCKKSSENDILSYYKENLSKTDQFFFVRYNFPKNHIRLRLKTSNIDVIKENILIAQNLKSELLVYDYKICTYNQEINRYGGYQYMELAERFFYIDSKDYLDKFIFDKMDIDERVYAISKIVNYCNIFNLSLDNMLQLCEINIQSFSREFNFNSDMRKAFNKEYSELKNQIVVNSNLLQDFNLDTDSISGISNLYKYTSDLIHMSLNRSFDSKQRFNEFKSYYFTKQYLNKVKFKKK